MSKIYKEFYIFIIVLFTLLFGIACNASQFPNDSKYSANSDCSNDTNYHTLWTVPANHTWTILEACFNAVGNMTGSTYSLESSNNTYFYLYGNSTTPVPQFANSCIHPYEKLTASQIIKTKHGNGYCIQATITYVDYDLSSISNIETLQGTTNTNLGTINTSLGTVNTSVGTANTSIGSLNTLITNLQLPDFMHLILGFLLFGLIIWFIFYVVNIFRRMF